METRFRAADIEILCCHRSRYAEDSPAVWLIGGEAASVYHHMKNHGCLLFGAAVEDWGGDLSPWPSSQGGNFAGNAREFLNRLLPAMDAAHEKMGIKPQGIYLAGYSLAGLFALWAMDQTDLRGVLSASGSLWYEGFLAHLQKFTPRRDDMRIYLSLGRNEHRVKDLCRAQVMEKTTQAMEILAEKGICTRFTVNPGGHHTQPDVRIAMGVDWLLSDAPGGIIQ